MPRMRILSSSEQEAFDKPPQFDHRERKQFLDLPKVLEDRAAALRTPSNQVGFLVMRGYFKATKRFYLPQEFHERDIGAAARTLGLQCSGCSPDAYAKQTRSRHQQFILDYYGFAPFDAKTETALANEITAMARFHLKPRLMFDRCIDFLVQRRFQVPRSGILIELIRSRLQTRKVELIALMDAHLTDDARGLLDSLFTAPEGQNRYRLTLLKKLPQSTRPSRVKEAAADFETLKLLHDQLEDILSVLGLGSAGVRYFAGSVLRSRVFQIQRREDSDRHIHAAAFIEHQCHRCQDNLIDLWLRVMAAFQAKVAREHADSLLENRRQQQKQIKSVVDDLDISVFGLIRNIRGAIQDNGLSGTQKVDTIRSLLDRGSSSASFESLKADLDAAGEDQGWHELLEKRSQYLQNRLNPILRTVTFEHIDRAARLGAAIDHFN